MEIQTSHQHLSHRCTDALDGKSTSRLSECTPFSSHSAEKIGWMVALPKKGKNSDTDVRMAAQSVFSLTVRKTDKGHSPVSLAAHARSGSPRLCGCAHPIDQGVGASAEPSPRFNWRPKAAAWSLFPHALNARQDRNKSRFDG